MIARLTDSRYPMQTMLISLYISGRNQESLHTKLSAQSLENQCLLQMLNVMEIRRRYIIKAFQIPTDYVMWTIVQRMAKSSGIRRSQSNSEKLKLKQVKDHRIKSSHQVLKIMIRFKINPCNGPNMWKKSPSPITLTPPDYHTPVGRPSKKRKKSAAELFDGMVKKGKLSRAGKPSVSLRPTAPSLRPNAPSLRPNAPSLRQTAPFLRPTAHFVTPRFTKNTVNRLSLIKKPAGANGKGKNLQE
ncbi:hypothetical protein Tco_0820180 [Tanacetum coccineum]|uniref:Uncharacterized protein n=1 Tax=Tanacetum coccineum TaxID=301880 RepID=A0ABQ5AD09_9ASTR